MEIQIKKIKNKKQTLFNSINMELDYGDFIHIIGKNGSGKSTFFKALIGLYDIDGEIFFSPKDVAIISDYSSLPDELYVFDIVKFLRKLHNDKLENNKLCEIINIDNIFEKKISHLSSGEKRILEIYSALISGKKL